MKKQIITIITLITLTSSYIQSADWISDNLPKDRQVDPAYRNLVKEIQKKTGTSTPIIFMNGNDEKFAAAILNIGAGPCRFAVMAINQTYLQNESLRSNVQALTHETGHIDQNHNGINNALLLTGVGMITSSPLLRIAQFATSTPLRSGRALALGAALTTAEALCDRGKKSTEHEAEEISLKKLSQLGLCNTLEALSEDYATMAKLNIPRSEIYPPYSQMREWAKERATECRENERKYRAITDQSHIMK